MNLQPGMSQQRFEEEYGGLPAWAVAKPQYFFKDIFSIALPKSPVIDIGSGTGDLSMHVASLGCETLGIDFAPRAVELAKLRAENTYPNLTFKQHDAFDISSLGITFNTVLDCLLYTSDAADES